MTAVQLINHSLEAHGGQDAWDSVEEISYSKRTILYDSLGTIESDQTKIHAYSFRPTFTATMTWDQDSVQYRVNYSKEKTTLFLNDSLAQDATIKQKFEKEVRGAYYVYWMPYKLLDANAENTYQGLKPQPKLGDVHVLEVRYPDSENVWWYYFDTETFKLVGTKVYHEPTSSFIKNAKHETETELSLNAERSSYRIDEAGKILFKRADYFYKVLKINQK
ncbi:MAG: hypothetical protein ACI86C_000286 [Candidatus Latescibacterota bacterium]|jgi:hypothetical protein